MALLSHYDRSLRARSAQAAIEVDGADGAAVTLTFGDLERRSNQRAHLLAARGLRRGDRLAFYLPNRIEFIDLWLAAVKLGVIVVPINVLFRERELTHLLRDAEPAAVVTTRELQAFLPGGGLTWEIEALNGEADAQPAGRLAEPGGADWPVALMYTSGTTGPPKGAVLTQGNFTANALTLVDAWEVTDADRSLAALPLFHAHGLANGLHCWLFSGCHLRLYPRFDHTQAAKWFAEYRPTLFLGVPTMFIRLLEVPPEQARAIGAHLRLAVSGAAPLPAEVHGKFRSLYGTGILERYGMTETLGNAANPYRGERRIGTVGPALEHVEIRVCDDEGRDLPDGTTGELWVRGPNVCAGYWRRPEATAAAWRDGWFRTGDLGVRAPDGYLTLEGRRSDLIISGGFKIQPQEIEDVLREQPGVRDAGVAAAPDPVRGEVPVAYVVIDGDRFDEAATAARLRAQLASFKQPRALIRVDAIPRTPLGKVQRHLLSHGNGPGAPGAREESEPGRHSSGTG